MNRYVLTCLVVVLGVGVAVPLHAQEVPPEPPELPAPRPVGEDSGKPADVKAAPQGSDGSDKPGAVKGENSGSKTGKKAADEKTETLSAATASETVPQVIGLRDGTLGIPAYSTATGLQAALDASISDSGESTDAFAKLGGLTLNDRFSAEFIAETYQSTLPRTPDPSPHFRDQYRRVTHLAYMDRIDRVRGWRRPV